MRAAPIRYGTPSARWILAATVLGSGIAFLDGTVVNVALPAIGRDLDSGFSGLQWILDGYLVTLSSLLLVGGSLGDLLGRRKVFVTGLIGFTAASLLCGLAPNTGSLIGARVLQGATAAFLVPGSLAIISATFHPDDRSRAVGAWSGLAGVSTAIGPFFGGWLVDQVSWRLIFLINLPLAACAVWIARRHVPESRDEDAHRPDVPGAVAATVGLAGLAYALIEGTSGVGPAEVVAATAGVVAMVAFVLIERASAHPMLPLELFRSSQFTGSNLTTLGVYAGLGGAMFLVVLQLQVSLGYSAMEAGGSLLPITLLMLVLSSRAGQLAQRAGPRLPMTAGPLIAAAGLVMFGRIQPGAGYAATVLPAALIFGLGLTTTVAPLTAAVLGAVDERHVGAASGTNNAVARVAGLLAVALLPALAGIEPGPRLAATLGDGFPLAMRLSGVACAAGALVAAFTVRRAAVVKPVTQASVTQACHEPCLAESA